MQSGDYHVFHVAEMEISFNGKVALVTGAGKGIGKVIAKELARCGAHVIALSRTQSDLDSLKEENPNMQTVCLDLSNWEASRAAVEQLGNIDLLVNNAAVAICEPAMDAKPDDFDIMMNINAKAVLNMSQIVANNLINRRAPGAIVNISSQASMAALADHVLYSATKAAVDSITRSLALEFGSKSIRVNAVNPTVITTDMSMVGWSDPAKRAWMTERIPLGRFGEAIEVANPVLFLLSDKASMVNGVCLPIDGGFIAC